MLKSIISEIIIIVILVYVPKVRRYLCWCALTSFCSRVTPCLCLYAMHLLAPLVFAPSSLSFFLIRDHQFLSSRQLNAVFLLGAPDPKWAACAVWIIPLIIFYDEFRKIICRTWPNGWVRWATDF